MELENGAQYLRLRTIPDNGKASNHAVELRLYSGRNGGKLLAEMAENGERNGAHRPKQSHDATLSLKDLGLNRDKSSRWQALSLNARKNMDANLMEHEFCSTIETSKRRFVLSAPPMPVYADTRCR